MHPKTREKLILTVVGWVVAVLIFFPIFWMVLTSFKTEIEAVATPPKLFFAPTLENYTAVRERADYVHFALQQRHHLGRRHPAGDPDRRARRPTPWPSSRASGPRTCCSGCCRPR